MCELVQRVRAAVVGVLVVYTAACGGDGGTGPGAGDGDGGDDGGGGSVPVPAAPQELSVERIGEGEVALRWTDASSDESGFEVRRRPESGTAFQTVSSLGAGETSFIDETVDNATRYHYRVRAVNAGGASDPSNEVAITTPEALDQTLTTLRDVVRSGLPPLDTPLDQRNPGAELRALVPALLDVPDVVSVFLHEESAHMQVVLSSGLSLVMANHPIQGVTRGPTPPAVPAPARIPNRAVPGTRSAVALAYDGGDAEADAVARLLENAGFNVQSPAATVGNFRNFQGLGALYLDTHGVSLLTVDQIERDANGQVTNLSIGPTKYGLQIATVTMGANLGDFAEDLRRGDLVFSLGENVLPGDPGNAGREVSFAITESFIRRHWSLDDAVVILHSCFGGADTFTNSGSCFGACATSAPSFWDASPIREAMLDVGAAVVMSFDNYTWSTFAWPSVSYFLDRTLGLNEVGPAPTPKRRPFPLADIVPAMEARSLMQFASPKPGRVVNVTFDYRDPPDWIVGRPTIAAFDVIDDAVGPAGVLQVQGTFSDQPGTVRVDGRPVSVTSWDPFYIEAQVPFDQSGPVVVEAPGGLKSNEVPLTEWRGIVELRFEPGDGDLEARAEMEVVFRADVHRTRFEVEGEAQPRSPEAYISGESSGRVVGLGTYNANNGSVVTYSANEDMGVLSKFFVDQGGALPFISQFGGIARVDGQVRSVEICLFVAGVVNVKVTGADGTMADSDAPLVILPEELVDRVDRGLGCIDLPFDTNYGIPASARVYTEDGATYTLEWTDFVASHPPTDQTEG